MILRGKFADLKKKKYELTREKVLNKRESVSVVKCFVIVDAVVPHSLFDSDRRLWIIVFCYF